MAWFYVCLAIATEIIFVLGMKHSHGFTRLVPTCVTLATSILNMWLLALAMRTISAGTAYAVWTGGGVVGTVLIGIFYYKEPATFFRMACVFMILAGAIGLKLGNPVIPLGQNF